MRPKIATRKIAARISAVINNVVGQAIRSALSFKFENLPMNIKTLTLLTLIALPQAGFGQKKEILEMQRDMSLLQDQMRTMQRGQDEKFAALEVLLKQTLEASNKANTSVALLEAKMTDRLANQDKSLALPIASMGTKVDAMGSDFGGVREAVRDLESKIAKMQGQLVDLSSLVKLMNEKQLAPPPAPLAPAGEPAKPNAAAATVPSECAGTSAEQLFNNAMRDRSSGNSDLAVAQFQDYVKCYGTTDRAPTALYNIGVIYYLRGDHENAIATLDKAINDYPQNTKIPDAMLVKARALVKVGQKESARAEFKELIAKYPDSDSAAKARVDLVQLNPARPASTAAKKKRK